MKGKVTIELHDAKTGRLMQREEHHNLVTNALKYVLNCESSCGHVLEDDVFPIATRGLGGILLFDGKLTEDVNNVYMPGTGSHLIGYANGDTNTSDIHRGSYNSAESGEISGGYKSVWDFGTAQCNGTIAAVARTSSTPDRVRTCTTWESPEIHADRGILRRTRTGIRSCMTGNTSTWQSLTTTS